MPKALVIVTNSTSQNFAICQKITCLNVAVLKFSSQSIILLFIKRHTTNIPCLTFPDVSANVCTSDYILKKDCKYSSACGKRPFPCQMCAAHKIAPNGARSPRYIVRTHMYRKGVEAKDESIFYPAPCGGTACRPVPAGRYGSAGLCS